MSTKLLPPTLAAVLLGSTAMADVPAVAVDIAPVHSLVARVMEGVGTPELIVPNGASPHDYRLRPSDARALQNADVLFWMGEGLTPWMEGAIDTLAENADVTTLLEIEETQLLEFREGALFEGHDHGDEDHHDDHGDEDHHDDHGDEDHHDEHGDEDHHDEHGDEDHHDEHGDEDHHDEHGDEDHHDEHGDEDHHDDHGDEDHDHGHDDDHAHDDHGHDDHDHAHGAHDPHAWLSVDNASAWLNVIAAELSAADPANAGTYFANAAAAREELNGLKDEIDAVLEPVRGKSFVVFHDAYQYFEMSFGVPASGAIALGDATTPSPARIAEIQARVENEGITCVLSEPQFNPGIVAVVMDGTGANTGVLDPLGSDLKAGADLYPQLLRNLAGTLADCLD